MDDGADLVSTLQKGPAGSLNSLIGGSEETTTGVIRLRAMEQDGVLPYPIISVNDALTKHLFDNRYGTGQSTIDGILRATNLLIAGRNVVVAGYGWVGRGIAQRMAGHGAHVTIIDRNLNRLRELDDIYSSQIVTLASNVYTVREALRQADLVVGAVLVIFYFVQNAMGKR